MTILPVIYYINATDVIKKSFEIVNFSAIFITLKCSIVCYFLLLKSYTIFN